MKKLSLLVSLAFSIGQAWAFDLLPNTEEVRESLITSPKIIGAESRRESLNYKAESIATILC